MRYVIALLIALVLLAENLHAAEFTTYPLFDPIAEEQPAARTGQVYYLFVGIGKYTDRSFAHLSSPPKDARAMAKLLPAANPGEITLLLNDEATKANIKAAFDRIRSAMQPENYFVFYFSGHGRSTISADHARRWNFLQPVDSLRKDYSQDIGTRELDEWLAAFPTPEHVIVILDSCFSGGLFHPAEDTADGTTPRYTMLTASADNEFSLDTRKGSLFTKTLLAGLTKHKREADTDNDNTISAQELFDYAAPRTTSGAKQYRQQQHPQLLPGSNPPLFKY